MKYAHFFGTGKNKHLTFTYGTGRITLENLLPANQIAVTGKREARKVAKELGAMPYNF